MKRIFLFFILVNVSYIISELRFKDRFNWSTLSYERSYFSYPLMTPLDEIEYNLIARRMVDLFISMRDKKASEKEIGDAIYAYISSIETIAGHRFCDDIYIGNRLCDEYGNLIKKLYQE